MGLTIGIDPARPGRDHCAIVLALSCDTPRCCNVHVFAHADGYIGAHQLAMLGGWMDTVRASGRVFLCPACSGKLSRAPAGGDDEAADPFGQISLI